MRLLGGMMRSERKHTHSAAVFSSCHLKISPPAQSLNFLSAAFFPLIASQFLKIHFILTQSNSEIIRTNYVT